MLHELEQLRDLRLQNDWTWEQLAEEMNRHTKGAPMSPRTLHFVVTYDAKPRERTLHKIRLYLAAQETRRRRRAQAAKRRRQVRPAAVSASL
jgi:hypothetical protein